jgi:hypothetical protein
METRDSAEGSRVSDRINVFQRAETLFWRFFGNRETEIGILWNCFALFTCSLYDKLQRIWKEAGVACRE